MSALDDVSEWQLLNLEKNPSLPRKNSFNNVPSKYPNKTAKKKKRNFDAITEFKSINIQYHKN